jgi:hypothetical protein
VNGNEEPLVPAERDTSKFGEARRTIPTTKVDALRVITCPTSQPVVPAHERGRPADR